MSCNILKIKGDLIMSLGEEGVIIGMFLEYLEGVFFLGKIYHFVKWKNSMEIIFFLTLP